MNDGEISREDFDTKIAQNLEATKEVISYHFARKPKHAIRYSEWVYEVGVKNKIIDLNKSVKDKEMARRRRSRVYWMDFGVNVGSEFNDPHFCVVIRESYFTAIVVPISSVKEDTPEWKISEDLIVEIGCLDDLPEEKRPNYAMVNQIKTVSKQRLSTFKYRGSYREIELSNMQMDIIDKTIISLCSNRNK